MVRGLWQWMNDVKSCVAREWRRQKEEMRDLSLPPGNEAITLPFRFKAHRMHVFYVCSVRGIRVSGIKEERSYRPDAHSTSGDSPYLRSCIEGGETSDVGADDQMAPAFDTVVFLINKLIG